MSRAAPAKIDAAKIALIHVAKKQLELSEEAYRQILDNAEVESAKDLDPDGFHYVMRQMERLGFQSTSTRKGYGRRRDMATPGQLAKIRSGWSEYTGGEGTEAQLNTWLHAKFGISALRFLDRWTVGKAIHALRCMNGRRANPKTPRSPSTGSAVPAPAGEPENR